jgi:hypothetical protein
MAQPERFLVVDPREITVGYHAERRMVLIEMPLPADQTGFAEGLGLMIQMAPDEARQLAQLISRKAGELEAGGSPN